VAELSGGTTRFFDHRIQFSDADFRTLPRPVRSTPMRIMFAGRIEADKGVFDILTICELLAARRPGAFVFDICGGGGAFEELRAQVIARGLERMVTLHGKLVRPDLLEVYAASELVIVPTRSTFCEGLPGVCAEAVLAGRPVLTSRLSNALDELRGAVIEAREDDPADYAAKIEALADDASRYAELVRGTELVRGQFTNRNRGMKRMLERCLLDTSAPATEPAPLLD